MYKIMFIFFVIFSPVSCLAQSHSERHLPKKVLQPMCQEFCGVIKKINFLTVNKLDNKNNLGGKLFADKMKKVIGDNKKDGIIAVQFLDNYRVTDFFQPHIDDISGYVYYYQDEHNKTLIKIDVRVVAPNQFYVKTFDCDVDKINSCIDTISLDVTKRVIGDYLFKPVIGEIQN